MFQLRANSPETQRSPNLQTDDGPKDKYDAAFKRLGQDEYILTVVNSLGECADPVDFFCQSSNGPVLQDSSEINCPDYQEDVVKGIDQGVILVFGKIEALFGLFAKQFWKATKFLFIIHPLLPNFLIISLPCRFVRKAITDLLAIGFVVECSCPPSVINPLSVSIQSNGKKRLVLDLRYPNSSVRKSKIMFEGRPNYSQFFY